MALNKSKSYWALSLHAFIYSLCFVWYGWLFWLMTFLTHGLTDAITSRITSKLWFIDLYERPDHSYDYYGAYPFFARIVAGKRHWFFVMILFDQLIHFWTLGLTYQWLVG
jgi:hypothetical protein